MIIDSTTYRLSNHNYYDKVYNKNQIIIGNTYRTGMLHFSSWINRINGFNKKTSTFTITKNGNIYQHYEPKYYSDFIKKEQDKSSISIVLENVGWFKKDSLNNIYYDWLNNQYKLDEKNITSKRWRNYNYWDNYSNKQMESLSFLVKKLCEDFNIDKNFIGNNVYNENSDLFDGILFRSNYYQHSTDVSPSFDFEKLQIK
jgi:hypothetical protein